MAWMLDKTGELCIYSLVPRYICSREERVAETIVEMGLNSSDRIVGSFALGPRAVFILYNTSALGRAKISVLS